MKRLPQTSDLRVLWVDDDQELTSGLVDYLAGQGYRVDCAPDLANATRQLQQARYDLVLVDLDLPDGTGLSLIRDTPRSQAREFVVVTGHGNVGTAVQALRHQVFDYLMKPLELAEVDNLLARVSHARMPTRAAHAESAAQQQGTAATLPGDASSLMLGQSAAMRRVHDLLRRAAASDITVFIQGESGTGKEVAANCLHRLSNRSGGPFVAFNCAAISPSLIASELFGHEKGSFTGALRTHRGIFERADGGTLLLDEITEMPLDLQASLLRVLETGAVVRVGGDRELPINVRIIAATNREPMHHVEQGRFRLDLYYRLQVFPVELMPLRERVEDIPLLARHFLSQFAVAGKDYRLSQFAEAVLLRHNWPGNVRELRNVIERACLLSGGEIAPEHLLLQPGIATAPPPVQAAASTSELKPAGNLLRDAEQGIILQTLAACGGNKTRAAAQLGVSVKTLYNKLKRLESKDAAPQSMSPPSGNQG